MSRRPTNAEIDKAINGLRPENIDLMDAIYAMGCISMLRNYADACEGLIARLISESTGEAVTRAILAASDYDER